MFSASEVQGSHNNPEETYVCDQAGIYDCWAAATDVINREPVVSSTSLIVIRQLLSEQEYLFT